MCIAIALARREVPKEVIDRFRLERRCHAEADREEFRFRFDDPDPRLPIRRDGQFLVVRWGNTRNRSRALPRSCWTWRETIESGYWAKIGAVKVEIPASLALEGGVWYPLRRGIWGVLAPDERGKAVVFVACEPSTSYYRTMTRSDRMPMFIGETI